MTSPDDFSELEQQLTRAFRAHGESIEPSPDAYARLVGALDQAPSGGGGRLGGLLRPFRGGGDGAVGSVESLRPLAFVAAVALVAGLGGYALVSLGSTPTDTATAAPATADASDLIPGSDDAAEDESTATETDPTGTEGSNPTGGPLADVAEDVPRSSVPSESAPAGTASRSTVDPAEEYAGLTYAPVRISPIEAARAFLDLLAVDDVSLDEEDGRVIVRSDTTASADDDAVLTVLTIEPKGDGFMVAAAASDRLDLSIDNATADDPTADAADADEIDDETIAGKTVQLSGTTAGSPAAVVLSLRSTIDGSILERGSPAESLSTAPEGRYLASIPVTGAERAWAVATDIDTNGELRSLAAQPLLYTGRADPLRYTVIGLPPDDPDGGLVIRATPNGDRIGVISLGSTDVRRRLVPPRQVDGLTWWAVSDPSGLDGWVAARYLAVDDNPADTTLVELARDVIASAVDRDASVADRIALSRPVFVGSIVDPRPVTGLADVEALLTTRRRLANGGAGGPGAVADYFGVDRWNEAEVFVPKGYRQSGAAETARAFFGDLPSVVIRSINPETGGWERVHLFVTSQDDTLTLVGIVLEVEPVSETGGQGADPPPPPGADG